ncbi:MAG: polynucleotide adenylyltransferase PcnB, partial [Planctomycetota bacterium]
MDDEGERAPSHEISGDPHIVPAEAIDPTLLDQDALRVVSRLERQGYEAYLVGGCVRDLMIGRKPKDFDLATSAHPRQVKRLFRNGRIIGRRFRLVHIHYGDRIIETATFRREPDPDANGNGALEDLLITEDNDYGTAEEDARRRDFTVNALFLNPADHTILDYVGGLEDLDRKVLRTIGDPRVRLAEDPVRILRAIKFATRLGFRIEDETWEAMKEISPELERSAPARVMEEILRLMRSGSALGAFRMMRKCGALSVILPTVDEHLGPLRSESEEERERVERCWRLFEALDSEVHRGYAPSNAILLAVLFYDMVEQACQDAGLENPTNVEWTDVACDVFDPVVTPARLSRRDCVRARRIMFQQRRFTQTANRRFRPLLFMRSEEFEEALALFRLRTAAWGQGWDVYEGWVSRYESASEASDDRPR